MCSLGNRKRYARRKCRKCIVCSSLTTPSTLRCVVLPRPSSPISSPTSHLVARRRSATQGVPRPFVLSRAGRDGRGAQQWARPCNDNPSGTGRALLCYYQFRCVFTVLAPLCIPTHALRSRRFQHRRTGQLAAVSCRARASRMSITPSEPPVHVARHLSMMKRTRCGLPRGACTRGEWEFEKQCFSSSMYISSG